jgi:hypothetical protein
MKQNDIWKRWGTNMEIIILVGKVLLVILGIEALIFGIALVFLTWAITKAHKEGEEYESTGLSETVEED